MCFCYFKIKVSRSNLVKKGRTCPGLPYPLTQDYRPVGWSDSGGGFFFKEVELPKARGLGAASGVQVGGQGAKPPEALKFTSLT